jgi:methylenetetrahydrofolate dehydrogenase (NADP+)/methenyltetrahydrofolate cyclohydrolase
MMQILDGKAVALVRRSLLKTKIDALKAKSKVIPGLAVILVGEDKASQVYVANKIKACHELGIASFETRLKPDATEQELKSHVDRLNADPKVHGMLIQLPLPKSLDSKKALSWVNPGKDADCLTLENLGLLWAGEPRTMPCTPNGVMAILEHYKIPVEGANAVVVGRSAIVGKPMAHLLSQANATVTICHSKTKDLRSHLRSADIAVIAAGQPEFLGREDFGPQAVVIDVGIHRKIGADGRNRLCGDVRFGELEGSVKAATPVPGGVGPMTITMLLENTIRLYENSLENY